MNIKQIKIIKFKIQIQINQINLTNIELNEKYNLNENTSNEADYIFYDNRSKIIIIYKKKKEEI